ncbi:MAG: hypothetical protein C0507_09390 [Cyanobacteria bacterium PR.3.49]|nr:hypothetical protein [Cyanobacteria bacterium PR.3.49]
MRIFSWLKMKIAERFGPARILTFDGHCRLCRKGTALLHNLDIFDRIELVDFTDEKNIPRLKNFDIARAQTEMLLETESGWKGGFNAFKEMALSLPLLWLLVPFLYLPGITPIGEAIYRQFAKNRYLLLGRCDDSYCQAHTGGTEHGDKEISKKNELVDGASET